MKPTSKKICPICSSKSSVLFSLEVFQRDREVLGCVNSECKHVWFADVNWLDDAYSNAIVALDTGAVQRSINIRKDLYALFESIYDQKKLDKLKIVDYGGGAGLLCRLMRDVGLNAFNYDKYSDNVYSRAFQADSGEFDIMVLIEVLEHLVEPLMHLEGIINKFKPNLIVFSTELTPDNLNSNWWYLTPSTGQHVSFFSDNSINLMASKLGYKYFKWRKLIVFSRLNINTWNLIKLRLTENFVIRNLLFFIREIHYRKSYIKDFKKLEKK